MSDVIVQQESDSRASAAEAGVYRMSREGRRQAIILLVGVASLWVFALWTLITLFQEGLSGVEWVSLVLMVGILAVGPLVGWTLLEEATSMYIVEEGGLRFQALGGIDIKYEWGELGVLRGGERGRLARFFLGDDGEVGSKVGAQEVVAELGEQGAQPPEPDELLDEPSLLRAPDRSAQIASPLARILHRLAHGSNLPVHSGVENREELVREIGQRVTSSD